MQETWKPPEVGFRGFAGHLLCKVLTQLGIVGLEKMKARKSITDAAE